MFANLVMCDRISTYGERDKKDSFISWKKLKLLLIIEMSINLVEK